MLGCILIELMESKVNYICPMHPDVTSDKPGSCPKCGMKLVAADKNSSMPCCSKHSTEVDAVEKDEKEPKSFIKRFLYEFGKKDLEKNGRKKECC